MIDKKPLLFFHHSMKDLAEEIAASGQVQLADFEWKRFEAGWPNLFIKEVKKREMFGANIYFLASFHSPEVVFEQYAAMCAIPHYNARSLNVILPFFPVGTKERVEEEGEVATAMTMARMLGNIPPADHPTRITILDIHALQTRFYFGDKVKVNLDSAMDLFYPEIAKLENVAIAFPDDGAHKRFHKKFPSNPKIICNKVRDGEKKIVKIKEGDPSGKNVVMVDDLINTGGTSIECGWVMMENGAKSVSALVTHGVFPEESWKKFTSGLFTNVWITNSIPTTAETVKDIEPFRVVSIAPLINNLVEIYSHR